MKNAAIIAEADILVPNDVPQANKVNQLQFIDQEFFNVVKIPKMYRFPTVAGQTSYTLPADVRSKNIDKVQVESFRYQSLERDDYNPTQNGFSFDDATLTLSIYPAPYAALQALVRYHQASTKTFTVGTVSTDEPSAPAEYHWTYVAALAAYLAKTQDDMVKAANFEAEYKSGWNVAAQNYLQPTNGRAAQ